MVHAEGTENHEHVCSIRESSSDEIARPVRNSATSTPRRVRDSHIICSAGRAVASPPRLARARRPPHVPPVLHGGGPGVQNARSKNGFTPSGMLRLLPTIELG